MWDSLREKWKSHYLQEIPDSLKRNRKNLLIAARFTEAYQTISWVEWLAYHGGYYIAIRELRYLLEAMIQAYFIDSKFPKVNVYGKLAFLEELNNITKREMYGSQLIQRTSLSSNLKKRANDLYRELSSFIHPTEKHISKILTGRGADRRIENLTLPIYDREMVFQCYGYCASVLEIIIEINKEYISFLSAHPTNQHIS